MGKTDCLGCDLNWLELPAVIVKFPLPLMPSEGCYCLNTKKTTSAEIVHINITALGLVGQEINEEIDAIISLNHLTKDMDGKDRLAAIYSHREWLLKAKVLAKILKI